MLGKLIKYDWKSFWKVPATINLSLIIITLVGAVSLVSPLWNTDSELIASLMVASIMFYYLAIFAGSIAVQVYVAVRYYKNVYTDEGYLTHTLPVKPRDIILSKLLIGFIWTLLTGLVILFSIFFLLWAAFSSFSDYNLMEEFLYAFREVGYAFERELGMNLPFLLFSLLIFMLISTVFSILMIFSSIALGQLFTKHKVMGAVMWYIIEYVILQFGTMLFANVPILLVGTTVSLTPGAVSNFLYTFLYGSITFIAVLSAIMFFISELIMRKNLNLD